MLEVDLGELAQGAVSRGARDRASKMRDEIAQAMWDQYMEFNEGSEEIV